MLGDPLADELAPLGELGQHLADALLRAFERRQRRVLADAARVRGFLALQVGHRRGHVGRREGPADSPAGHGVGLAHAVDDDRPLLQARPHRGEAGEAMLAVDQLLVDLVGDRPVRFRSSTTSASAPSSSGEYMRAGRIRGRAEQQDRRLAA